MTKRPLAAMLSCEGPSLTDKEKKIFSSCNPLGITLFGRNLKDKAQILKLTNEIKETIGRDDVLIAVDQEGGRVRRLKEPEFMSYASQYEIGSLPLDKAQKAASLHAELISRDLKESGINVNFAPVLDISYPQTTEALKSRCFSSSADTVANLGQTMLNSYIANGIIPCIKHMPGHGQAISDPHLDLPVVDISIKQLEREIYPFQQCAFSPLGMTAHILLPQLDKDNPATQSHKIIKGLIRREIGFEGLLISDSIDMKALKGNTIDKALKSLEAGCDSICYCLGNIDELEALARYCPQLSDEAMERLDKACKILHNNKPKDADDKTASVYTALMRNASYYEEHYDATEVLNNLKQRTR